MNRKKILSRYKDEPLAYGTRRFFSGILDALFLIILTTPLLILSSTILTVTPTYASKLASINEDRVSCYKIEEEAGIYEFSDNGNGQYENPVSIDSLIEKYALSHILLSYDKDPDAFKAYNVEPVNSLNVTKASYESDQLSSFYTVYSANHNVVDFAGVDPKLYFIRELKSSSPKTDYWVNDEASLAFPYLKGSFACDLYRYLLLGETSFQTGLTDYNYLASGFHAVWEKEANLLFLSPEYKAPYQSYLSTYQECAYILDGVSVATGLLAYVLLFGAAALIFKNGQTFGNKIFHLYPLDKDGYEPSVPMIIVRGLVGLLSFAPVLVGAAFLAYGSSSGLFYPLISIGSGGLSLIHILSFLIVISIINLIMSGVNSTKRTLTDYASGMVVVDYRLFNPALKNEILLEKEKKDPSDAVPASSSAPVLDSTTFDNAERKETNGK